MEEVSDLLLNQRIRNRIIETLEVYVSVEDQKLFGPDEVINMWDDFVDDERLATYDEPAFNKQEQLAISVFHNNWNRVCDNTPQHMPPIEQLVKEQYWVQLMNDAREALLILAIRGRLDEDQEII